MHELAVDRHAHVSVSLTVVLELSYSERGATTFSYLSMQVEGITTPGKRRERANAGLRSMASAELLLRARGRQGASPLSTTAAWCPSSAPGHEEPTW